MSANHSLNIYTHSLSNIPPLCRVTPHGKSGRADFFGQTVNRAARLMAAAYGGQIVCERSIVDSVISEWKKLSPPNMQDIDLKPSLPLPMATPSFPSDKTLDDIRATSGKSSQQLSDEASDPFSAPQQQFPPMSPRHSSPSPNQLSASPSGHARPGVRFARSFLPSASSGGQPPLW